MKHPLLAIVLVCGSASVFAQEPLDWRTITVVRVSGLSHIDEEFLLAQLESAPGRPFSRAAADRDRVRLDRLGVFGEISLTARALDGGVQVDVAVTETLRILPTLAVAVTDENGASAGPAVRFLSIGGRPQEMSVTARFGGETLVEFNEVSPLLRDRRLWHSARLSGRDRFNKLDQFDERSLDLDARIGLRASEQWKTGAIVQVYRVGSDQDGITLSPDNPDTFVSFGVVAEYDTRDSWKEPTRGWWNSVDALWRTGTGQYATLDVDLRRFQPVATRQTIVATTLLTLQSGTRGVDVPPTRTSRSAGRTPFAAGPSARDAARISSSTPWSIATPPCPLEAFACSGSTSTVGSLWPPSAILAPPGTIRTVSRMASSAAAASACACSCPMST